MATLWEGTVSVLFTDIESSTAHARRLGTAYGDALSVHRRILREAVERDHGIEVDTQGDSFFFVFRRAADAVAAAVASQRTLASAPWPGGQPLRVRMAAHTTEPGISAEGYVGVGLTIGARLCAVAHGSQILLSETTAALLAEYETPGVGLRELGNFTLKGIERPQRVFQVLADGLPTEHPPLRVGAESKFPRAATMTVFFSDIVGATALLRERGRVEFGSLLDTYTSAVRSAVEAEGGWVVDEAGDHVFALFELPNAAVNAARSIQRSFPHLAWPSGVSPQISIALHSGELERIGDRYVGLAINRCAALSGATRDHGIVLSNATQSLLDDERDEPFVLRDLGEIALPGGHRPIRAYELVDQV